MKRRGFLQLTGIGLFALTALGLRVFAPLEKKPDLSLYDYGARTGRWSCTRPQMAMIGRMEAGVINKSTYCGSVQDFMSLVDK